LDFSGGNIDVLLWVMPKGSKVSLPLCLFPMRSGSSSSLAEKSEFFFSLQTEYCYNKSCNHDRNSPQGSKSQKSNINTYCRGNFGSNI
jgi:hypothetical protein